MPLIATRPGNQWCSDTGLPLTLGLTTVTLCGKLLARTCSACWVCRLSLWNVGAVWRVRRATCAVRSVVWADEQCNPN